MMAWKQHANLFYFDRSATDLDWPMVNDHFGSVAVLCDNYFDRVKIDLSIIGHFESVVVLPQ